MIAAAILLLSQATLRLPANTAYLIGPGQAEIGRDGSIRNWTDPKTKILWGGRLTSTGILRVSLNVTGADPGTAYFLVDSEGKRDHTIVVPKGLREFEIKIKKPRWIRLEIHANGKGNFGKVSALTLSGSAAAGAQFNLKERRNSASVHIGHLVPPDIQIEWMYNEVKATAEPLHTFYEACGFSRGYFGMQINSPTERRVIFSVWDAGSEAVDRGKVGSENRVKLLAKGEGVEAGDFGNEGTGGHSHRVTAWKTNETQKFLLHAEKDGDGTIYTGYYFLPEKKSWQLIASFRAPKDSGLIKKMYSFIENFGGETGYLKRSAEFGPVWIRTTDGYWLQCQTGRFTHDKTGGVDRFDYDFKVKDGRFLLQNGGFEGSTPKLGDLLSVDRPSSPPKIDLNGLPKR